jgi:hypothetical protein
MKTSSGKKSALWALVGLCVLFSFSSLSDAQATEDLTDGRDVANQYLDVSAVYQNFTDAQEQKANAAMDLLKRVVNSEEFKLAVLNYTWKGKKQFSDNQSLSNEQIYEAIMAGAEILNPVADHVMNLDLTIYKPTFFGRNVVGYTYPYTPRIWMNRNFFNRFTPGEIAGNMTHEWCHKIGFTHDYSSTARRPYSVPYALGYLIRDMAEEIAQKEFLY